MLDIYIDREETKYYKEKKTSTLTKVTTRPPPK
jgi:hypothetical protein